MTRTGVDTDVPAHGATTERQRLFAIDVAFRTDTPGPGLKLANKARLIHSGHYAIEWPNGTSDQYPETPQLTPDSAIGGPLRDFEYIEGLWIVSEALKQIFEAVDREAFAFTACNCTLADGSAGPLYYLSNVVRELDALDENTSQVKIKFDRDYETGTDVKYYSILGGASLSFRREAIGSAHIFRQPNLGVRAICDQILFDAVMKAGVSGVEFRDVSDL